MSTFSDSRAEVNFRYPKPADIQEPVLDDAAKVVLERRYLQRDEDGNTYETYSDMYWRVAAAIAYENEKYDNEDIDGPSLAREFYDLMVTGTFLPNSPCLMNAGSDIGQLSACFVLPVDDSIDGIYDAIKNAAIIHKSGGGTGFAFSDLRPKNAVVGSTGGVASGPVSFLKIFDCSTEQIKQGGKRRGANMGVLNIHHPDIMEFIESKAVDGVLNNFNLSVGATEAFMEAVRNDSTYDLIDPRTKEVVDSIPAKPVFDRLVERAWGTGDPGILFLDEINKHNPTPALGEIKATNPCITGDTVISTICGKERNGISLYTVNELIGKPFKAVTDSTSSGFWSTDAGFFSKGVKDIIKVTFSNGQFLRCTPDHKILMLLRGTADIEHWVAAEDTIKEGDRAAVVCEDGSLTNVVSIEPDGQEEVFDCQIPGPNRFAANGIIIANCGEVNLLPYEACNLGSINLTKFFIPDQETIDESIDWTALSMVIRSATRFLDNVVDGSKFPLQQITEQVHKTRKLGLGVMGWGDLLYQLGIKYNSEEGVELGRKMMKFVNDTASDASRELARTRGVFPAADSPNCLYPNRRNATVTVIAPTGTLSMLANCSGGIEPNYGIAFTKTVMDKDSFHYLNQYLVEALEKYFGIQKDSEEYKRFAEAIVAAGCLSELDEKEFGHIMNDPRMACFVTAPEVSPEWHLKMQAAYQENVENAVSKTVNLPNDATIKNIADIYIGAYKSGCKGVTVYRDGSKFAQVLTTGKTKKADAEVEVKAEAVPEKETKVLQRPAILTGSTYKIETAVGALYLTVNEHNGKPIEVFPTIGKSGKTVTAMTEALGRMISIALRSGVSVKTIISQLDDIVGGDPQWWEGKLITSVPDAIAEVLKHKYSITKIPASGDLCPECGRALVHESGCAHCPACQWSKCSG